MHLKYQKNILPAQDGASKIMAIAWAPNNSKLAVCTSDRVILLYDEFGEKKDKFSTKPANSKYGKRSYVVKGLAFSPDSTKIAIGQTDNIIFVYRIGDSWHDKKTICNKFVQSSAVTCMIWPLDDVIVCGLADGKVRQANIKINKSSTLYATDSYTCCVTNNVSGKGILSGHADGSVVRYYLQTAADGSNSTAGGSQGRLFTHPYPPYVLVWAAGSIMVAACDKRVMAYLPDAKLIQTFDYSKVDSEYDFTAAACSPGGQSIVLGSFDRLRVYNWSPRKSQWEEGKQVIISNMYTVTAIGWKRDGTTIAVGSLCGAVEIFECCLKKILYKNKFEIVYVGINQVLIKNVATGSQAVVRSHHGYEIEDVKVLGRDRYVVAHTAHTLILGDLSLNKVSEIPWKNTESEKFYFDYDNMCMIFSLGTLNLVEYGENDILGSVRTEFMNPHLLSVRLNERKLRSKEDNKKMAYLIDLKTICVVDLLTGLAIAQFSHDSKLDWLELSDTGRRLLFRDRKLRLFLADTQTQHLVALLNYASFVQWVPDSDVIVAQSRDSLCVWYNPDLPDNITTHSIQGDVVGIEKSDNKTEVLIRDGSLDHRLPLSDGLVEFGTAVEDGNYSRAISYLEAMSASTDTEAMWLSLAKLALEKRKLFVAMRCYAAVCDISKVVYLQELITTAEKLTKTTGCDGMDHHEVRARLALLERRFDLAESIYTDHGMLDSAVKLYVDLGHWDRAVSLAQNKGYSELDSLRERYFSHLLGTGQEGKAAEVKANEGSVKDAVDLYLKAGRPGKAADLALVSTLPDQPAMLERISSALLKSGNNEKAGAIFDKLGEYKTALDCFRKADSYAKAIELARIRFPREVVTLEEDWGDFLARQKQPELAISHYIEAGKTVKALEAAIGSHQYDKAGDIIGVMDNPEEVKDYYIKIGRHYEKIKDYDNAERFFIDGKAHGLAVDMLNRAGLWNRAHRLAAATMAPHDISGMYITRAREFEKEGRWRDAEKLYVLIGEPDSAIAMHKRAKNYEAMVRMVKEFHPDLVNDTYLHLAKELESIGDHKQSEKFYLAADDWKSCVNMYRQADLWEDAYRVAKQVGGQNAGKHVAVHWASSLGGEAAVKLLTRLGLLEVAVEYAGENNMFDFAFELANQAVPDKLPDIYLKHAMALEDEGRFGEAEAEFVKAAKPKEAILMHVHNQDWASARRVAELHQPDMLPEVLVGQGKIAFDSGDRQQAEALFIRAEKADLVVQLYKEREMYADAIRVASDYLPNYAVEQLQREIQSLTGESSYGGAIGGRESSYARIMSQAKQAEMLGDMEKTVMLYLTLDATNCPDVKILEKAWLKSVELSSKFLDPPKTRDIAMRIGPRLISNGFAITAAQCYLMADMVHESIDAFILAEEWTKARRLAEEMREEQPDLVDYVETKYKDILTTRGNVDQLADVDAIAALELYAKQGNWKKCLELAEHQSTRTLQKYVALNAAELLRSGNAPGAVELFAKHGAAAHTANFNIYRRMIVDSFSNCDTVEPETYQKMARLRDVLYHLCSEAGVDHETYAEFDRYLLIAHYMAVRCACLSAALTESSVTEAGASSNFGLDRQAARLSIALLRHTDILPADKQFYEAGLLCKRAGWDSMAFVFFNRVLDLCDAIDDNSPNMMDNTDFEMTDIPMDAPLPDKPFLSNEQKEEIKETVLTMSMQNEVDQTLPNDDRGVFEGSLRGEDGSTAPPCIISGYPVLKSRMDFGPGSNIFADKEAWNKFVMATKVLQNGQCQDALRFVSQYAGVSSDKHTSGANFSFSF